MKHIKDILIITIASALYSWSLVTFILPYGILTGGIAGICNLIYYACRFPVEVSYPIINGILYLVALKFLGWRFLAKTIYATLSISFFIWLVRLFMVDPNSGELVMILGAEEKFMSLLIGCSLMGIAIATLFSSSGSSGGSDIIAAVVNKYYRFPIGTTLLIFDFLFIGSALFIPKFGPMLERIRFVAFGICAMGVECVMITYVLNVRRRSVQFMIFTRRHQEVSKAISDATGHTMTLLDGHGWYTGKDIKVICVLARMYESAIIFNIIKSIDPAAFVSQSHVIGVWGEGFEPEFGKNS